MAKRRTTSKSTGIYRYEQEKVRLIQDGQRVVGEEEWREVCDAIRRAVDIEGHLRDEVEPKLRSILEDPGDPPTQLSSGGDGATPLGTDPSSDVVDGA